VLALAERKSSEDNHVPAHHTGPGFGAADACA
jgi:hypothetical protein